MYAPSPLYVPSKIVRADPEKLSGILLIVGKSMRDVFFEFASLDSKRLEEIVETFPEPARGLGRWRISNALQNAPQSGLPRLIYFAWSDNLYDINLNPTPKVKAADRYNLGFVTDGYTFEWDCLEVALGYFLEYDPSLIRLVDKNLYKT